MVVCKLLGENWRGTAVTAAATYTRGVCCPHGHDEWLRVERKSTRYARWACATCKRDAQRKYAKERRAAYPAIRMLNSARYRARRDRVPFSITLEHVKAVYPADGRCPALGIALSTEGDRQNSPSLDRINPAWGYEPGNIAVVSHRANTIKGNATAEELEQVARWMRANGLK